jgi:hypothetical protein
MTPTIYNSERIRRDGLKSLKDALGIDGMIKFIQMYSDGQGDYTEERGELLKNDSIEDFERFVKETKGLI